MPRDPVDIALLPHAGALVTERPGRVRRLTRHSRLLRRQVARMPVSAVGEGGLLGIALDPAFASNHFVYMYFTAATGMRLERRRWTGKRLAFRASLIDGIRAGSVHDSGRIAFGPDRRLYVSTGDSGRAGARAGPGLPKRQDARPHARPVPRAGRCGGADPRERATRLPGARLAARHSAPDRGGGRTDAMRTSKSSLLGALVAALCPSLVGATGAQAHVGSFDGYVDLGRDLDPGRRPAVAPPSARSRPEMSRASAGQRSLPASRMLVVALFTLASARARFNECSVRDGGRVA
jgi:hypothetical protein